MKTFRETSELDLITGVVRADAIELSELLINDHLVMKLYTHLSDKFHT